MRHLRPKIMDVSIPQVGQQVEQFGQSLLVDSPCLKVCIFGGFTLVDIEDLHLLEERRWNLRKHRRTAYVSYQGRSESIRFHRLLVTSGESVDHRNGIGWDNRRFNLRESDSLGQSRNQRPQSHKLFSKYKGVGYDVRKELYRARIMVNRKSIALGKFKSEIDAARAYDRAALKYFGEFAVVNFHD